MWPITMVLKLGRAITTREGWHFSSAPLCKLKVTCCYKTTTVNYGYYKVIKSIITIDKAAFIALNKSLCLFTEIAKVFEYKSKNANNCDAKCAPFKSQSVQIKINHIRHPTYDIETDGVENNDQIQRKLQLDTHQTHLYSEKRFIHKKSYAKKMFFEWKNERKTFVQTNKFSDIAQTSYYTSPIR